jgi:Carboxypeptidase regulatory-like domain
MKLLIGMLGPALLLMGQSQPAGSHAGQQCFIEGRVVSAANGEPVGRVMLTLRHVGKAGGGAGEPANYTTLSDAQGRFAMQDIEPGKYQFSAERTGFASVEYGARRPGRSGTTLSLDTGQRLSGVVFRLTPQAVVAGRIVDEDGDPVERVSVRLMPYIYRTGGKKQLTAAEWAETDDLGEYRLFGLSPGNYLLEATYQSYLVSLRPTERAAGKVPEEGYVPTYYPGTTDIRNAIALELAPGTQLRGMDFTLSKARTVRVRGRVGGRDLGEQMIMITLVPRDLSLADWDMMRRTRVEDPQGRFELTGVRPGSYVIVAMAYGGAGNYSARRHLDVGITNLDNVDLMLSAGVKLTGELRTEGRPPAGLTEIQVSLRSRDQNEPIPFAPSVHVKEDGSFTLSNVGAGVYRAAISGLPDGYYVKSVRMGDDEVKDSGIDTTHEAGGTLVITVSDKAGQIDGVVLNAKQQPTPGAFVVLIPEPKLRDRPEEYRDVTTDQYGRFVLKNIEPGEYKLFAWEDLEEGEYMDPEFLKPVEQRGYPIQIREGSRESVELKLIAAAPPPAPDARKQTAGSKP